ncbi:Rne/Rng family ribonuclease [Spectribacter hydrogenoxidans]|uniref:Ribonuclease E n=1 Tax=Spectribacter hydrogenoxidans TaxID=3075608 RepID=A0ABU3C3M5_9GAMM|nr:Rne/Rng family ribonuclease [Salinisphaera sp. W335]MDT0636159.1 Rne/Rng family ribonuclease [Salinisphaera sp. W335]
MKRILINATQPEELRVAIVDGQQLRDLDIEVGSREQRKANVYKGRITRVEPSLEAAFVDYGGDRHGFLPLKEVARGYFKNDPGSGRVDIKQVLSEGQELIVQVEKEERGNKGAALTTFVSLAGRYLVLMPNNPRAGGVSRRIAGDDRTDLREALSELELPSGMGVIVRTAGVGRSPEELQWDLDYLAQLWEAIGKAAEEKKAPFLVYQESNVIIRALRDYLRDDIGEVIVDQPEIYESGREFMEQVMPQALPKLKLYNDETPLFSRFQVESQIESAFQREVRLPSGGALIIDHTEALTSIDINSARSTGGAGIEETALHTNCEAADEIARQLRLRDLGGLIVIDFIDMDANKNQREVERRLREAATEDRARVQFGRISRFGLLEMSRQRLRPSLGEYSTLPCPRCSGQGNIRSVESLALSILRLVEEEAMKGGTGRVMTHTPVSVASFLLNEKRGDIADIEKRTGVEVTVVPNADLETPHHEIRRVRADQLAEDGNDARSYKLETETPAEPANERMTRDKVAAPRAEPAVKRLVRAAAPAGAAPKPAAKPAGPGIWQRFVIALKNLFSGNGKTSKGDNKSRTGGKTSAASSRGRSDSRDNRRQPSRRGASDGGRDRSGNDRRGQQNRRGDNKPRGSGSGRKPGTASKPESGDAPKADDNKRQNSSVKDSAAQDNNTGDSNKNDNNDRRQARGNKPEDGEETRSRSRRGRRGGRRRRGGRGRGSGNGETGSNNASTGDNTSDSNNADQAADGAANTAASGNDTRQRDDGNRHRDDANQSETPATTSPADSNDNSATGNQTADMPNETSADDSHDQKRSDSGSKGDDSGGEPLNDAANTPPETVDGDKADQSASDSDESGGDTKPRGRTRRPRGGTRNRRKSSDKNVEATEASSEEMPADAATGRAASLSDDATPAETGAGRDEGDAAKPAAETASAKPSADEQVDAPAADKGSDNQKRDAEPALKQVETRPDALADGNEAAEKPEPADSSTR